MSNLQSLLTHLGVKMDRKTAAACVKWMAEDPKHAWSCAPRTGIQFALKDILTKCGIEDHQMFVHNNYPE